MGRPTGAIIVAVIACVFLPMSLIALGARLWSRRMMKVKLCLNDYFAILATVRYFFDLSRASFFRDLIILTLDRFLRLGWPWFSSLVRLVFAIESGFN